MDLGLRDRAYVITGGSRGLGYAAAQALVADGARVVLGARDAGQVAAAVAGLGAERAVGVATDNRDPDAPRRLITAARESFGAMIPIDGGALRAI
jgi:3-oxoacyl-[acyl-carrier protein] reductase